MELNRRGFLKHSLAAATAAGLLQTPVVAERRNGMPYRRLGRTEELVSLLCLGGAHIGLPHVSDEEAIRIMRTAVDEGVNFFDNAWAYSGGVAEERMGKALQDGYRDKVFLMTKHKGRDAASAEAYLEESLRRLQVEMIDLWQFHEVIDPRDPERLYSEGAIEVALKAKEVGKIRYIGFTGHHITTTHVEMIERGFAWDTVQIPLNTLDFHYRSFEKNVVPLALEKDIGIIGMKPMSVGELAKSGAATPAECLRYAMNLPVATVCSGMDSMEFLKENLATAKSFQPLEETEVAALRAASKSPAEDGAREPYKTTWHVRLQEMMREELGIEPS